MFYCDTSDPISGNFSCFTTALVESLVLDLEQSEAIFHLQDFFPEYLEDIIIDIETVTFNHFELWDLL